MKFTSPDPKPPVGALLDNAKAKAAAQEMILLAARAGVRDKASWDRFVPVYRELTRAMTDVIDPAKAGPVAAALSEHLATFGSGYLTPQPAASDKLAATNSVVAILRNRHRDLTGISALLADPGFTDGLFSAWQGAAITLNPDPGPLPEQKEQELLKSLLQPLGTDREFEPAPHIYGPAWGIQRMHQELAHIFSPQGPTAPILAAELQQRLPELPADLVRNYAQRWLFMRQIRAQQTADLCLPESPVLQEAVRLSEQQQLARPAVPAPDPVTARNQQAELVFQEFMQPDFSVTEAVPVGRGFVASISQAAASVTGFLDRLIHGQGRGAGESPAR